MAYFNLKCCSPTVSRVILLALNIIVLIIGAAHFGFASQFSTTKKAVMDQNPNNAQQAEALADPPMIYYIIGTIIHCLVCFLIIVVLFEIVGKDNRLLWFRIMSALVILTFAINFCMAVYASITVPYYKVTFSTSLEMTDIMYAQLTGVTKDAVDGQRNLYRYTQAEAVYTWVLAVPCLAVLLLSLLGEFVDENTVNGSVKVSPGNQNTTQIDSFGNGSNNALQSMNEKR